MSVDLAALGVAIFNSSFTRYPLTKTLLYNPNVMGLKKVKLKLANRESTKLFESRLLNVTSWLSATFIFSAVMNYVLAKWITTFPSGSSTFNEELGRMTLLSYPVIALVSPVAG